jgi:hypothetical protein
MRVCVLQASMEMGDVLAAEAAAEDDRDAQNDFAALPDMHVQLFEYYSQDVLKAGFDETFWQEMWRFDAESVAAAHARKAAAMAVAGASAAALPSPDHSLVVKPAWLVDLYQHMRFVKGIGTTCVVPSASLICWGPPNIIATGAKGGSAYISLLAPVFKKVRADLTHTALHDQPEAAAEPEPIGMRSADGAPKKGGSTATKRKRKAPGADAAPSSAAAAGSSSGAKKRRTQTKASKKKATVQLCIS